jgi:excisionase family DNA binding protein
MYLSVKQLAENLGVSTSRINKLIADGRIRGAFKVGNVWVIPVIDGKPQATKGSRGPELTWKRCRPNPVSRLHVNQEKIRKNNETGAREEVISCKTYEDNRYGHEFIIYGSCKVVYQPDNPLDCGAKVWIETYSQVDVIKKDFSNQAVA